MKISVPAMLMGIFEWWSQLGRCLRLPQGSSQGQARSLCCAGLALHCHCFRSWDIVNFLAGLCPHPKSTLATNALLGSIISLPYCLKFEPNTKPDPEISLDPTACILRFRWSQHVWGHRACLGSHVLAMVTWLPAVMASARGPRPWWGMPWGHRSLDWHAASHS